MTPLAERPDLVPTFSRKLSVRFALVLAVALLPLGVASLVQTRDLQVEVQRRTEAALLGETLRAAAGEIGLIRASQGAVAVLAKAVVPVIADAAACSALMRATAAEIDTATLVAFLPPNGLMTCSSSGRRFDFAAEQRFITVRDAQAPAFVVNRKGPVTGASVLGISHPVRGANGVYLGYVTVSLPHSELSALDDAAEGASSAPNGPVSFWTFDAGGEVLTANGGLEGVGARLPSHRRLSDFVGQPGQVFQDLSVSGYERTYAVVALVPNQLYLMSSWNAIKPSLFQQSGLGPYLPALVMWAVGLIVAAWAAEYLVARHIRVLNRSIASFARGNRRLEQLDLRHAPIELQEVADAYLSMTETITLGEAKLEDSIHQKEVLLREVHHRVKNNLQLIASIMNMQMRKAIAPEAKLLLKGLQDRVMSLATIHRGLYQTSGLVDVRADELFPEIVRQIIKLGSGPDKHFDLALDIDDLRMTPDQAVPLSLLLTEAMTNALKYAGAPSGQAIRIAVRLKRAGDGGAVLEVANTLRGTEPAITRTIPGMIMTTSTGLGAQLLMAFAQQVGGALEQTSDAGEYRLSLTFQLRHLADAENRSEPAESTNSA